MTQVEKKGSGAIRIGLFVCIGLVVLLAISNLLVYSSLQSQINSLNVDRINLQSEKASLQTQVTTLQSEVNSLKAAQLHEVNEKWSDNHPLFSSPYISISGAIFNSGTNSASNVMLTVKIYNSAGTLLKSEDLTFGTIQGKSYSNFDTTIGYSGDAAYIITTLSYS